MIRKKPNLLYLLPASPRVLQGGKCGPLALQADSLSLISNENSKSLLGECGMALIPGPLAHIPAGRPSISGAPSASLALQPLGGGAAGNALPPADDPAATPPGGVLYAPLVPGVWCVKHRVTPETEIALGRELSWKRHVASWIKDMLI